MASKPTAKLRPIIVEGNSKELVKQAKTIGERLATNGLTTSQIRNVFGAVRQIEMRGYDDPASPREETRRVLDKRNRPMRWLRFWAVER